MPTFTRFVQAVRKTRGDETLIPLAARRHGVVWVSIYTKEIGSTSQESQEEIEQLASDYLRSLERKWAK